METTDCLPMDAILAAAEQLAHVGGFAVGLRSGQATWTDEILRLHGFDPREEHPGVDALVSRIHVEDRAAITALLDDVLERPETIPAEGVAAEYRVVRPDGSVRVIRFLGRIEHDEAGEPAYWLGCTQDVTEQRLTERELHVHYALSQVLRDWQSSEGGVVALLRRLGTALEFPLGSVWTWDEPSQRLGCRAFWTSPDVDGVAFEQITQELSLRAGEGAPGRVWETRGPVVVPQVASEAFIRRADAARLGLVSAIAVPAIDHTGAVVAILAFYSPEPRAPSERVVAALAAVGLELGRFLNRQRLGPRMLTGRELDVLRLAAEGCSGPEIAEELVVSPSTVKSHFENVYEKLGVGDRAAAVARALRTGLID